MDDKNPERVKSEVEETSSQRMRNKIRDDYCGLKARTLHNQLPFFTRQCVSVEVLKQAMIKDWDCRMNLLSSHPYLWVSQEDLLLHILRNPQILKEPELVFLRDLIKLEEGIIVSPREG